MKPFQLCIAALLIAVPFQAWAEDAWPSLPTGSLAITNLGPRSSVKSVRTERFEVNRDGKRIASITKADRNGDGRFEEFIFTAFVSTQRVVAVTHLGGTNESAMFFSFDDVMVMTDVQIPESDTLALLVVSKKHKCYEIFARQPGDCYWPANEAQSNAIDALFRTTAKAMSPLFEKLAR